MDCRIARILAGSLLLSVLSAAALHADDGYSLELDANENPVFSQIISWEPVEGASGYTLEIQDEAGAVIVTDFAETTERTVHLGAGEYRYRVTAHNILGKPDAAGDWNGLVVRKAERPAIVSVKPRVLYLDSSSLSFEVYGENIFEDSAVSLQRVDGGESLAGVSVAGFADDGSLSVILSKEEAVPGEYRIRLSNPGGLFADDASIFKIIQARRTVRLSVVIGWCSWVPLYDSWYTGIWNQGLYLPGAEARLYWSVSDEKNISFGARGTLAAHWFDTEYGGMTVSTDCRRIEAACFAQYRFSPVFHALAGAGAGFAFTYAEISALSNSYGDVGTIDPSINAFFELRYAADKHWFAGAGTEFLNVFYSGKSVGVLLPEIFAGYKF